MIARKVPSSRMPLPQESRRSGRSSGNNPYFDGPKIALCTPIRKIAARPMARLCRRKPSVANAMIRISSTFTPMVTVRLLKRSAKKPPAMENRMNGSENNAAVSGTSALCRLGDRARFKPM